MEKNVSLCSVEELVDLLKSNAAEELKIEAEGELIKRIKAGECDVSVLDGIDLPSMAEEKEEEEACGETRFNSFILPGAYAFPSAVSLVVMLVSVVVFAINLYALISGGYFTDLMSVIYYGVTVLLVEFGKVFIAGLALHLLTDIAYNTFKNRKK